MNEYLHQYLILSKRSLATHSNYLILSGHKWEKNSSSLFSRTEVAKCEAKKKKEKNFDTQSIMEVAFTINGKAFKGKTVRLDRLVLFKMS